MISKYLHSKSGDEIISAISRDDSSYNLMCVALRYKSIKLFDLLFSHGVDPVSNNCGIVNFAIDYNYCNIVEYLLSNEKIKQALTSYQYQDILKKSCNNGYFIVVKHILENKCIDPTFNDNVLMRIASKRGCTRIVRYLLMDDRIDISFNNNYILKASVFYGHADMEELFLSHTHVNINDIRNAIIIAKKHNHSKVVELLTRHYVQYHSSKN